MAYGGSRGLSEHWEIVLCGLQDCTHVSQIGLALEAAAASCKRSGCIDLGSWLKRLTALLLGAMSRSRSPRGHGQGKACRLVIMCKGSGGSQGEGLSRSGIG